ncbi:hypothetical protein EAG_08453 [Camponotus floridanus]|uniref:Uncharacterized protein n=1 Tax=Camponotus floridanus TaxID=104421 RepID=E1ZYW6_CAMFO|nr:hypothetical protein EAG_08453 [Camponotus floridanus]
MKVFYFQMSEVSGLDFRLFYAGRSTEDSDIRDVLFRNDQVESRRLVVKLIAEDAEVLFQMLETDHFGRKNCKNVCHRGMNSARAIAFYGNVVFRLSPCSVAPTYDPAIWLAGERLRGNSKEIGLLLKVVHDDDDDDIDDDMHA